MSGNFHPFFAGFGNSSKPKPAPKPKAEPHPKAKPSPASIFSSAEAKPSVAPQQNGTSAKTEEAKAVSSPDTQLSGQKRSATTMLTWGSDSGANAPSGSTNSSQADEERERRPYGHSKYHPVRDASWKQGEPVPYGALTQLFSMVEAESKRLRITDMVTDFLRSVIILTPDDLVKTVYLCRNQIAPAFAGVELGVGDFILIKALAEQSAVKVDTVKKRFKDLGDLGFVAEEFTGKQRSLVAYKPLVVRDVFAKFQKIAALSGNRSGSVKVGIIKRLLMKATASEPRYLIRSLTGKLRIGLAQQGVLHALSRALVLTPPEFVQRLEFAVDQLHPDKAVASKKRVVESKSGADEDEMDCIVADLAPHKRWEQVKTDWDRERGRVDWTGFSVTYDTRKERFMRRPTALEEAFVLAKQRVEQAYIEVPSYDRLIPAVLENLYRDLPFHCFLTPGIPVAAMLGKPASSVQEVMDKFGSGFTIEYKYDGERAQIHFSRKGLRTVQVKPKASAPGTNKPKLDLFGRPVKQKSEPQKPAAAKTVASVAGGKSVTNLPDLSHCYQIFSRNSEDNSSKYPDIAQQLTRAFADRLDQMQDFIIDCEVVAWDSQENKILPFQVLTTRKRKDASVGDGQVGVCLFGFDLLYLNGESYIHKEFRERRAALREWFSEVPSVFRYAIGLDTDDAEEVEEFLQKSIKDSCEGLMVKALAGEWARYTPDRRNWLKVKKDYLGKGGDSLDLVPIGAYWGEGKRSGQYGKYLMATWSEEDQEFQACCKVGSGFNNSDLNVFHTYFTKGVWSGEGDGPRGAFTADGEADTNANEDTEHKENEHPNGYLVDVCPSSYAVGDAEQPDAWLDASHNLLFEIRFGDLTRSTVYPSAGGISCRFPRFIRTRTDKRVEDCTGPDQLMDMFHSQEVRK